MSLFIGEIVLGLSINLASSLAWDKKILRDNKKALEQIRLQISEFNRRYDNTDVDTYAFEKFIKSSKIVDIIYRRIFETYTVEPESIRDFKKRIAKLAIDDLNKFYEQYSRKIKNEDVFFDYFCDLVDSLISVRESLLNFESSLQTSLIADYIDTAKSEIKTEVVATKHELTEVIKVQFAQMRENNVFAEDRINQIKYLISSYKFSEAEEKIAEVLESQQLLSNSQREIVYFQRARVFIKTGEYNKLNDVINKIESINFESKYVIEIKYYIACHEKDKKMFEDTISTFERYKYSQEQLALKVASFQMELGNIDKVLAIISIEGEIKENLRDFDEAHYLFGIILAEKMEFNRAKIEFSKAFELSNNIIYKYNFIISKYYLLSTDIDSRFTKSTKHLQEVKEIIQELRELKYIIKHFSNENKVSYWVCLVSLIAAVDSKDSLREIDEIDKDLNENNLIRGIKAVCYFENYMDYEAKEILEDIWRVDPINTNTLFAIYCKENNWNEIVAKYVQLSEDKFTEHPAILIIYLRARSEIKGYENVRDDILRLSEIYFKEIIFIRDAIKIVLENEDEKVLVKILNLLNENKDTMTNNDLALIGELLNEYSKFGDCRNLLEERIEECEPLIDIYVKSFDNIDNITDLVRVSNEKVKKLYNAGCRYKSLLRFKAKVEFKLGIYRKVVQTLDEYKDIFGIDDYYTYYYVASKMEKNECEGIDEEVEFMLSRNNASFNQLVAALKARQGLWDEAQRIALSALYHSHDNLGKEILFNHLAMYFTNIDKSHVQAELVEVVNNSVVCLRSKHKSRNIAIHIDRKIINKPGEYKFECENYHSDDQVSLLLTSEGRKGEKLVIDDEEYEIENIIELYTYFYRFCLLKLQMDYPNHGYFISFSAPTPGEAVKEMKKTMALIKEDKHSQFDMYNFGIDCGMPISYLSGKNINNYSEIIILLLNHNKQHLYAGEISIYEDTEYVISISSIILLASFDMLDKLEKISNKCVITKEVEKSIRDGIKESQKHSKITSGVAALSENGEIGYYRYTEDDKRNRRIFWSKILQIISKLKQDEIQIEDNEIYEGLPQCLLDEDISSIELSKSTNKVMVCDDLFIRKLHHGITETTKTTNMVGLLVSEKLVTNEELIDLVLKLVKSKYLFPLNDLLMYEIFSWILSIQDEGTRISNFDKLKEIFKNILDDVSASYYISIYEEFVRMVKSVGIPSRWVYELVREPFKLKPFDEFLGEKSKEIIRTMIKVDET